MATCGSRGFSRRPWGEDARRILGGTVGSSAPGSRRVSFAAVWLDVEMHIFSWQAGSGGESGAEAAGMVVDASYMLKEMIHTIRADAPQETTPSDEGGWASRRLNSPRG